MDGLDAVIYSTYLQGQISKQNYDLINPKLQRLGDVTILTLDTNNKHHSINA